MDRFEQAFEKYFERLLALVLLVSVILAQRPILRAWFARISDSALRNEVESIVEFALPIAFIGFATRAFRKSLWKLRLPEMNFGGQWIGVSEYGWGIEVNPPEQGGQERTDMDSRSPRPLLTAVEFEQEMSVARLTNGRSLYPVVNGVTWSSTALTIHQGSRLEISLSYVVEEPTRRPVNAVETITVFASRQKVSWHSLFKRSNLFPQMLRGRFEHAWNGEAQFLHRGDTYYARVTSDELERLISFTALPHRSKEQIIQLTDSLSALSNNEELSGYFRLLLARCLASPTEQIPAS